MEGFVLCARCHEEYQAPDNRRFHAEPNACPECGPHLGYYDAQTRIDADSKAALDAAIEALQRGRILAVKGIGGFHLMCDAANELSVNRLRKLKHRPHKPLALMVPASGEDQLETVRELVEIEDPLIGQALTDQARPIILLPVRDGAPVCEEIAPDLSELGVMLPPSPMHRLLTDAFGKPVVATSGNISGEPVITDEQEAEQRLGEVAEGWLIHNRPIVRPADDTVKRLIHKRPRMIRFGRGSAPVEGVLPFHLDHPVLAVGGHMKNTVALAWQDRYVISPHIGELSAVRSMEIFEQVIGDLQQLYQVEAELIVCDRHPNYASSRWAHEQQRPVFKVLHHHAHASALAADDLTRDRGLQEKGLVFTWDGVGYGEDNRLWGGETFIGSPGNWRRVASFRNFRLIGGDRIAHEPWRSAAALHWELEEPYTGSESEKLAHAAWQSGLNSFESSAAGRLFDAAAAIMGITHTTSHEGEAPMRLEAMAEDVDTLESLPFHEEAGLLRIDWAPLFYAMKADQHSIAYRAGYWHAVLANTVVTIAQHYKEQDHFDYVGLSGGVFQNRRLTEAIVAGLLAAGIACRLHENVPANDGGISYGQLIEYSASHGKIN
jgi:hydrogenase maturation protein HypF